MIEYFETLFSRY